MKKIEEVEVNGEKVYLRKTFLGWNVVNPIKINGKWNLKNIIAGGNWYKLIIVAGMVIIILFCLYDWANAIKVARQCLASNKLFNLVP